MQAKIPENIKNKSQNASYSGVFRGWYSELKMINQIFRAMPFNQILRQFLMMSYLGRKTEKSLIAVK